MAIWGTAGFGSCFGFISQPWRLQLESEEKHHELHSHYMLLVEVLAGRWRGSWWLNVCLGKHTSVCTAWSASCIPRKCEVSPSKDARIPPIADLFFMCNVLHSPHTHISNPFLSQVTKQRRQFKIMWNKSRVCMSKNLLEVLDLKKTSWRYESEEKTGMHTVLLTSRRFYASVLNREEQQAI